MSYKCGDVVKYKNDFAVVLASKNNDSTLRIIHPHRGNGKVEISVRNATPTGRSVPTVVYNGKAVLVTKRGLLISLVSERLLRSDTKDGLAMRTQAAWQQHGCPPEFVS